MLEWTEITLQNAEHS
uniref:Uncharacterized protein n=1 Tax=Anguilla anguilla TaxID=7936 RepID=A0A0E9V8T0_ANGAN